MKTGLHALSIAAVLGVCAITFLSGPAEAATVYFIGSDDSADGGFKTHLSTGTGQAEPGLGHTVIAKTPGASSYADAVNQGADLIVISGSMGSTGTNNKGFHTSRIPIINFESFSWDQYGLSGPLQGIDFGDSDEDTDGLRIDAAHPITAGFTPGPTIYSVYDPPATDSTVSFGVPGGEADVLATFQGGGTGNGKPSLFVYERGDTLAQTTVMASGNVSQARGRYIGFFSNYKFGNSGDLFDLLNADGVQLFDQTVAYALAPRPPIAHYTFDADPTTDSVGDNDGIAMNGAAITTTPGEQIVGSAAALALNGINQYVKVDALNDDLFTGDFTTISLWFNTTGIGPSDAKHQIFSAHTSGGNNVLRLGTSTNGGIFLNHTDIGGPAHDKTAGSGFNDGQWHLLTVSIAGSGDVRVTVDTDEIGETVFSTLSGQPNWSVADLLSIGQEYDGGAAPGDYFDGLIDELAIWDRVLSDDEIESMYLAGVPEPSSWLLFAMGVAVVLIRVVRRR